MTDKQPDALRLADELEDSLESHDGSSLTARCQGIADDAAAELRRLHAENETLRAGYAAARLEIESLNAQLHAAKQINAAQPGVAYEALPDPWREKLAELAGHLEKCGVAWMIRTNGGTTYNVGRADGARVATSEFRKVLNDELVNMLTAAPTHQPAPQPSLAAQGDALESEYQRGYRQGYEQRDAEVRGALV